MKVQHLLLAATILGSASGLQAQTRHKSLIHDNVDASLYGEASLTSSRYGDIPTTMTRFEGGWLLFDSSRLATSIGISHAGFGSYAQKDRAMQNYDISYYGPVLKFLVPLAGRFSTALSVFYGAGQITFDRPEMSPKSSVGTLNVWESKLQLNYRFSDYTSFMVSAGASRNQEDIYDTYPIGDKEYQLERQSIRQVVPVLAMGVRLAAF